MSPREIVWRWLADLLVHPEMGIVTKVRRVDVRDALIHVAALYMRKSRGERVTVTEWRVARHQAQKARSAADAYAAADADAAAAAYADAAAYARITFTRWAIEHWRELAGLDTGPDIDVTAVDNALARIEG